MNIDWLFEEISEFKKSIIRQVLNLKLSKLETVEALDNLNMLDYDDRLPICENYDIEFEKQLKQKYPDRTYFNIEPEIVCENRYYNQSYLSELEQLTWQNRNYTDETMLVVLRETHTKEKFSVSYGELLDWIYNKAINEGKIGYNNDW